MVSYSSSWKDIERKAGKVCTLDVVSHKHLCSKKCPCNFYIKYESVYVVLWSYPVQQVTFFD